MPTRNTMRAVARLTDEERRRNHDLKLCRQFYIEFAQCYGMTVIPRHFSDVATALYAQAYAALNAGRRVIMVDFSHINITVSLAKRVSPRWLGEWRNLYNHKRWSDGVIEIPGGITAVSYCRISASSQVFIDFSQENRNAASSRRFLEAQAELRRINDACRRERFRSTATHDHITSMRELLDTYRTTENTRDTMVPTPLNTSAPQISDSAGTIEYSRTTHYLT